jgi:hypothetical protein
MNFKYFDVAIQNLVVVQKANGQAYLGAVELGSVFGETAFPGQMEEQLAAVHILHDETEELVCLKRIH